MDLELLGLCVIWFVLGIFTGAMILSDIIEMVTRGNRFRTRL